MGCTGRKEVGMPGDFSLRKAREVGVDREHAGYEKQRLAQGHLFGGTLLVPFS